MPIVQIGTLPSTRQQGRVWMFEWTMERHWGELLMRTCQETA